MLWSFSGPSSMTDQEWIEQPKAIQCRHPSGVPTSPGPTGFIAASGRNHIPGTGVTRRLLMEETRVLSLSDCRRVVTSAVRDRLRFESVGRKLERDSKGA